MTFDSLQKQITSAHHFRDLLFDLIYGNLRRSNLFTGIISILILMYCSLLDRPWPICSLASSHLNSPHLPRKRVTWGNQPRKAASAVVTQARKHGGRMCSMSCRRDNLFFDSVPTVAYGTDLLSRTAREDKEQTTSPAKHKRRESGHLVDRLFISLKLPSS